MKLGRFIVDSHVHAQRFAAGKAFKEKIGKDTDKASYTDLAGTMALLEPYDNSARLLYDMDIYSVDMCVLLPAFGMTNELNAELVERHPEHFVAVCSAVETAQKAGRGEAPWTARDSRPMPATAARSVRSSAWSRSAPPWRWRRSTACRCACIPASSWAIR
jgi:hypothetical protein